MGSGGVGRARRAHFLFLCHPPPPFGLQAEVQLAEGEVEAGNNFPGTITHAIRVARGIEVNAWVKPLKLSPDLPLGQWAPFVQALAVHEYSTPGAHQMAPLPPFNLPLGDTMACQLPPNCLDT